MKRREKTPPAGTLRLVPSLVTVRAKSQQALMSATAKTVAALKVVNHSEPVLVVYSDNAASVFCEQSEPAPNVGMQR